MNLPAEGGFGIERPEEPHPDDDAVRAGPRVQDVRKPADPKP